MLVDQDISKKVDHTKQIAMAILLLAFLIILSTSNSEYRKPFTAFHPAQLDHVQKQKHQGFVQSIHPLIQRLDLSARQQNIQNSQEDTGNGLVEANIKPAYRNGPKEDFVLPQRQQLHIQQQSTFPIYPGSFVVQATVLKLYSNHFKMMHKPIRFLSMSLRLVTV